MGDIHILEGTRNKGQITKRLVFHYLVPLVDRVVNAGLDPKLESFVSAVRNIKDFPHPVDPLPKTEYEALLEGIVIEVVESYSFYQNAAPAKLLAEARAMYAREEQETLRDYKARYYEYLSDFSKS